ncbi:MAG TPA: LuxR C-terminal-related transcriptional regulator [Candidatus Dormibacteraeota bacterium]
MRGAPRELSPRQAQILELVAAGLADKEIAGRLGLSVATVRTHLQRLYRDRGYRNRAEAAAGWTALRNPPPPPVAHLPPVPAARRRTSLALLVPAAALAGVLLLAAAARPTFSLPIQRAGGTLPAPVTPSPTGAVQSETATASPSQRPASAPPASPSASVAAARGSAAGAPAAAPSPPPAPQVQAATAQLALINQDRAAAGLPPLQWNACLAGAAGQVARGLALQGYLSPTNGVTLDAACALGALAGAENAGYWSSIDDARMNTLFMSDPAERARMLGVHRYVGAAWATLPGRPAYLVLELV